MKSSLKMLSALAFAGAALGARGEIKIFRADITGTVEGNKEVGSESNRYAWGDGDNWTPSGVPTQDDAIIWASENLGSNRKAYIDLDGDYSAGWLTNNFRNAYFYKSGSAVSDVVSLTFYHQLGCGQHQWHTVNSGVKLILASGAELQGALWDGSESTFTLGSGAEMVVQGRVQSRHITWTVPTGAVLRFAPSAYENFTSDSVSSAAGDVFDIRGGTAYFSNGLAVTGGNQYYANAINHSAGTVTFGGNFTSAETGWTYTWSGGTLNITNDCAFGNNISLVIPASSTVTLDVASGKTFSAPGLSADSTAAITKNGDGLFVIPPATAQISVTAGGIGFASASSYDFSNVSFAEGTKIAISTFNATIDASPDSLDNATFTADLDGVVAGQVILNSSSSNTAILTKAKGDIENASSVPAGLALAVNGTTLSVEAQSAYNFCGSGDILDSTYWGGTMPGTGAEVAITGATTVATLSSGPLPAWRSIEVKDGATLRIATNAILQPVVLNKDATLQIDNNAVVEIKYTGDLSCVATAEHIPVLSVASGAKLNVPGGMKFSNVNIDLKGTIATTTSGGVTFGYANNGETTYIGFAANGGTIAITEGSSSTYDLDPIEFCCPQSGSSVVAIGDLVLNEANLPKTSGYDYMTGRMVGLHLGRNNSENIAFNVVFNNTKWGTSGKLYVCGGATLSLTNNSSFITYEHHTQWDRYAEISGKGRLYLGEGSEFRLNSLGNYGDRKLVVNPSASGHNAIVVEHGAIFENYRWTGNNNGVFSVSNGVYRIFEPYIIENEELKSVNTPFDGLQAVNLSDDSVLTFTTRNQANGHGYFNNGDDRVVSLANVPITGAGSIALDNANVNKFGVIVTCGSNTATGSASVVAPGEGEGETTLYFADGANWAGTVTAGQFTMTNLVDAAAACTNSFGTVDLAAGTELQIRVWKTGGVIVAHDGLNVGTYLNNGGKIALVAMDEELSAGDLIELGAIGGESEPPAMKGGWRTIVNEGTLQLKYSRGFSVIFR